MSLLFDLPSRLKPCGDLPTSPGIPPANRWLPEFGLARNLLPSAAAADEDDDFDEDDFDDDFDDDFEDELDEELNHDLDEFNEQVAGEEGLETVDADEDFEEEDI
jgi:hypothetical protein